MTLNKTISRAVTTLGLTLSLVLPTAALAAGNLTSDDLGVGNIQNTIKLGKGDIRSTAGSIINAALGFLGIIAVVIVLLGGFKYMISGGNEEKTGEAKKLIVSGIIGLAIILSAWAITTFVISNLVTATTADDGTAIQ